MFEELEKAEVTGAKEKIIDRALTALKIHALLEEEVSILRSCARRQRTDERGG